MLASCIIQLCKCGRQFAFAIDYQLNRTVFRRENAFLEMGSELEYSR